MSTFLTINFNGENIWCQADFAGIAVAAFPLPCSQGERGWKRPIDKLLEDNFKVDSQFPVVESAR